MNAATTVRFSKDGSPIVINDPNAVAEWSLDQLWCVMSDPKELMPINQELVTQAEAIRRGMIPPPRQERPAGRLDELVKAGKLKVGPNALDPYHFGD